MALFTPSDVTLSEEYRMIEYPLLSRTAIEQEGLELETKQRLIPAPSVDTGSGFFLRDRPLQLKGYPVKIEFTEFPFNIPWLPPNVFQLLNKLKKGSITETELVRLMELVAKRASDHFQLTEGKFVAMTFHGQIIEVSDTRVGLLKKIQSRKYQEQIFVWRIGSNAFSGRI